MNMQSLYITILLVLLFTAISVTAYNMLYIRDVKNSEQQLGLSLPAWIRKLITINTVVSILSIITITLFLLRNAVGL